jgi:hypothetical protein
VAFHTLRRAGNAQPGTFINLRRDDMGLDMYAYSVKRDTVAGHIDVKLPEDCVQISYWRKFNNLHGWMEDLYTRKGGVGTFNCTALKLEPVDIARLRVDSVSLKPRSGFFYGTQGEMSAEDVQAVLTFCNKCDAEFADGYDVFYDSWW